MFRWPYQVQSHRLTFTSQYADPAPQAVLIHDKSFHLLGAGDLSHLDGIKGTPFDTGLTTRAFLFLDDRPEPAGCN